MTFKTQIGVPTYSWTEKHYYTGSSLELAAIEADKLARYRSQMLGAGVYMGPTHLGDDDVFRSGIVIAPPPVVTSTEGGIYYYNTSFTPTIGGDEGGFSDSPYASLLVSKSTVNGNRTQMYMGGNPDYTQRINAANITSRAWKNAFSAWVNYMIGRENDVQQPGPAPWGIKCIVPAVGEYAWRRVVNIDVPQAMPTSLRIETADEGIPLLTTPGQVLLRRMHYTQALVMETANGRHRGVPIPQTPRFLLGDIRVPMGQIIEEYQGMGYARKIAYGVSPYRSLTQVRLVKKSRGGSLFTVRGSRRKRPLPLRSPLVV